MNIFLAELHINTYLIVINFWVSSKILNVMSIYTIRAIMTLSIRTPNSLIFLNIKLIISRKKMNHFYFYFRLSMSKCTELFILAFYIFTCISFTKFWFISARVIDLLNFIMWKMAKLIVTIFLRTYFMTISIKISPSSICLVMIIDAGLPFMKIV